MNAKGTAEKAKKTTAKKPAKKAVKTSKAKANARTELVMILDRSGSMSDVVSDTIGGFNGMIDRQKKEAGECKVSTVLFDDEVEVLHNRVDLREIRPITEREYNTRGCTALLDAVGRAINHHIVVQRHLPENQRADKVVFVIITDGLENASREYTGQTIRRLVKQEQEKWGWEFIFIGANIDAIAAAGNIGIRRERAVNFHCDKTGVGHTFMSVCKAVSNVRACKTVEDCCADGTSWREEVDADFEKRK